MILEPVLGGPLQPVLRTAFDPSSGFSPASVFVGGAAGIWLDPADTSTGFQDSAGTIPQTATGQPTGKRLDKSGNANSVSQSAAAARPEYDVISGISSDFFDGANDFLLGAASAPASLRQSDFTIVVGITTPASFVARKDILSCGDNSAFASNNYIFGLSPTGATTLYGNSLSVSGSALSTSTKYVLTAISAGGNVTIRVNGVQQFSGACPVGTASTVAFSVGGSYNGVNGSFFWNSDIHQTIICPNQTAAVLAQLERWVGAARMGIIF